MAISVLASGTTSQTSGGAEANFQAATTTAGVYQLVVDVSSLVYAATADVVEFRVYLKPAAGGTEQLADLHTLLGSQSRAMWLSKPYGSPISVRFTVKQTAGTSRALPWGLWQYA